MDFAEIRRIVDELAGSSASEVKVETGGMKIHLRFAQTGAAPVSAPAAPSAEEAVTAPMPGVVYLAPTPGAAPFVHPGARVASGDTLLMVEAMKSMLPLRAPFDAMVEDILVADETPVEIGQPLIRLRPVSA